ncbi:MAG: SDR family oxidoreductase [Azonexus sp.]|jgi:NAD(P)-dependent dehydrogenase (short-subunit alcohol dehydrogenase family)|nr:SDR family oxidoreductase [Azonexus sp.]
MSELFGVEGKRVLITGASSGIGLHLAHLFAARGAKVGLAARRIERLESAVAELRDAGGEAMAIALDVTRPETFAAVFDAFEARYGATVEVLVNNSGIIYIKRFIDQERAEVERLFDTNLKGAFLVAQEAARRMRSAGSGSIINVASTAGLRAGGLLASYAASKAGLVHLTRVMALELAARGVRVNALCPGNIETDMHAAFRAEQIDDGVLKRIPMRRFGQPGDLDGAVLLLASDAGRYITGVALPVDGGQTLSWM